VGVTDNTWVRQGGVDLPPKWVGGNGSDRWADNEKHGGYAGPTRARPRRNGKMSNYGEHPLTTAVLAGRGDEDPGDQLTAPPTEAEHAELRDDGTESATPEPSERAELNVDRIEPATTEPSVEEKPRDREDDSGVPSQTALVAPEEAQRFRERWDESQRNFVDEPRISVEQADQLVAELMQSLAKGFASEREALESQWARGEKVSTEDLRQALQRYRSFFQRLLSV
jgi:hypothetical protein